MFLVFPLNSYLLNDASILQIALLQQESEIPVEELLARYKEVGSMFASPYCLGVCVMF